MNRSALPEETVMYRALFSRDRRFEGIFFFGVRSTGVFCRPSCPAKKPNPEQVEFFASAATAAAAGYRPCRVCHPTVHEGVLPAWLAPVVDAVEQEPGRRLPDREIRAMGIDPARVRRWFRKHRGMSFQDYARSLRVSHACAQIRGSQKVVTAALESGFESLSGFNRAFRQAAGCSPSHGARSGLVTLKRLTTPLGPMLAGATDEGICLLEFADHDHLQRRMRRLDQRLGAAASMPGSHPLLDRLEEQLKAYFAGRIRRFDLPLLMPGTTFQRKAWAALLEIPYGETRSYRQQAEALGSPRAARAVAGANGANLLAILVPCHRVIAADGGFAGYAGGVWRKHWLLEFERTHGLSADGGEVAT